MFSYVISSIISEYISTKCPPDEGDKRLLEYCNKMDDLVFDRYEDEEKEQFKQRIFYLIFHGCEKKTVKDFIKRSLHNILHGGTTWERIVACFHFIEKLSDDIDRNKIEVNKKEIREIFAKHIDKYYSSWIAQNGGWDAILKLESRGYSDSSEEKEYILEKNKENTDVTSEELT